LARLEVGEHLERALRELGPEKERLQARDDRVAPEHGHEPGHARGREIAEAVGAATPERRQVGDRARECLVEVVPGSAQARDAELPRGQRSLDAVALLAEALLRDLGADSVAADRRDDVDAQGPRRPRLELDPEADLALLRMPPLGQDDLRVRAAAVVI